MAFDAALALRMITNGRLRGDEIRFSVGAVNYVGRVHGDTMRGEVEGSAAGAWTAARKDRRLAAGDE